ncbi:MAG: hypothetical protein WAZ94_13490 [Phycisphaerales bacterium]
MSIYEQQDLGDNLSQVVQFDDDQDEAVRSHERGSTEPTIKPAGLLWCSTNTTIIGTAGGGSLTEAFLWYSGSAWKFVLDPNQKAINAGGTVAFAADQAMGSHKLTGLSAGSASGHSVRYEQVMLLSGANAMAADLDMGGHKVTDLAAPAAASDAARKQDVDDIASVLGIDSGEVSFSSDSTWSTVDCGFDWDIVWLRIESTGTTPIVGSTGDSYGWPVMVRLASDGSGAVTLKFAEGDTSGIPFHAVEFQRVSNGFQVRRKGTVSETITVRYSAMKNTA